MLLIRTHALLDLQAIETTWPQALAELPSPPWLDALTQVDASTPFPTPDEDHVRRVRDLLRYGGFKPAGRSKPCNEYIRKVAEKGQFPRINPAVDLTNAAALHGALPVSTVDLDKLQDPLSVGIAEPGASYVFNLSGQRIELSGLVCLFDAEGPAANAVKDSQRAKTTPESTRTLTLIWGTTAVPGRARALREWMVARIAELGGSVKILAG